MRVLVLGASGMLGHTVFRYFFERTAIEVFGTLRSAKNLAFFAPTQHHHLLTDVDVENVDSLTLTFAQVKPTVVINCIGVVKQLAVANDPLYTLPINALLPHRLARLCAMMEARLIHVSTDCVFSGSRGNYTETDFSDADDLYGRSKYLGEIGDLPHVISLRTSIIGHELNSQHGLLEWFLQQTGSTKGYQKAIFSGLPTVELARVMADYVLPSTLSGLYQVAAEPINKYALLQLFQREYGKVLDIIPDDAMQIDRSLNGGKFVTATGYQCPDWSHLVRAMREFTHV